MKSPLLCVNGTSDHVHLLVSLHKTLAVATLLLNVKRESSKWMKQHSAAKRAFGWQDGYFAFSIGQSGVEALRAYFGRQNQHHRRVDFKDEMRQLMRKYEMEWAERHVWE